MPRRGRALLWEQLALAARMHLTVRPLVRQELARWEAAAGQIAEPELRRQALASLHAKGFHCEGGSVYAAGLPSHVAPLVSAVTAFQTLVDYLDNLSDRMGHVPEALLRHLHTAVDDALTPGARIPSYLDGADGYLSALVRETQTQLAALPGYEAVAGHCRILGRLYAELQVQKHLPDRDLREPALMAWISTIAPSYRGWQWWELAAASGSTLGLFALWRAAARAGAPGAEPLLKAYFPWICALHILLDYYIDQAEDQAGGDFNLVRPYGSGEAAARRLRAILRDSRRQAALLPDPAIHLLVVRGLPALYLSDPKVAHQGLRRPAWQILTGGGPLSLGLYGYCKTISLIR